MAWLAAIILRAWFWFVWKASYLWSGVFGWGDCAEGPRWWCERGVHRFRYYWSSNRELIRRGENYAFTQCKDCGAAVYR